MLKSIKKLSYKTLLDILYIAISYAHTRIFYRKAKLIRLPFHITRVGKFQYGDELSIGPYAIVDIIKKDAILRIGKNFNAYYRIHIGVAQLIEIGNNVLLASNVYISDHSHGIYSGEIQSSADEPPNSRVIYSNPVFVRDNVWIGESAVILPGVTIGNNSIVGAGSIVTKDVPPFSIVAGNPAQVIKKYDSEKRKWLKV